LRQSCCKRRNLSGLLAKTSGDCAGERVEQQIFAMVAHFLGDVLIAQCRGKFRQRLCRLRHHIARHLALLRPLLPDRSEKAHAVAIAQRRDPLDELCESPALVATMAERLKA
jgi:hypothetical protein